ncbi:MAG: hypothetical protein MUF16_12945 [Burkholderiaceae bacterium]|nr:hypothetical protein [Burkholderiaceae bacterium]
MLRLARLQRFARDAGQAMQVLDMLTAQDAHQRVRPDHADQPSGFVDHRHRRRAVVQRHRGHALLVGARQHPRAVAPRHFAEPRGVAQCQQLGGTERAQQPPAGIDHAHQVPACVVAALKPRTQLAGRLAGIGEHGQRSDMVGRSLVQGRAVSRHVDGWG